jgi:hypothetical protein
MIFLARIADSGRSLDARQREARVKRQLMLVKTLAQPRKAALHRKHRKQFAQLHNERQRRGEFHAGGREYGLQPSSLKS